MEMLAKNNRERGGVRKNSLPKKQIQHATAGCIAQSRRQERRANYRTQPKGHGTAVPSFDSHQQMAGAVDARCRADKKKLFSSCFSRTTTLPLLFLCYRSTYYLHVCTVLSYAAEGRVAQALGMQRSDDMPCHVIVHSTLSWMPCFLLGRLLLVLCHDDRQSHMPPPAVDDLADLTHPQAWIPTTLCCMRVLPPQR